MTSSLHTKYRPVTFDGVLGQDDAINSLKRVVTDKRAKSFIFTGPSGTGKTTLARIMASQVSEGKATTINIEEIDGASNSGADAIRAVVMRSLFRALGPSPIKAIIVDEAHRLSAAAWTVLLKPIEEPPSHIYWFLCTTEAGKIPKAIQTRCLKYDLKPVKEDLLLELLVDVCDKEGLTTPDEVLEAIAENAGGSPRQALVYLEECIYCESGADARTLTRNAGQSKEAVDLCRFILRPQGGWTEAMRLLKAMDGAEAESIRIVVVNYLSTVLLNIKGDKQATKILRLLETFAGTYNPTDRYGPLLLSLGLILDLDK